MLGKRLLEQKDDRVDGYFQGLQADDASQRMQPMILGQELYIFLKEFTELMSKLTTGNQFFPIPIAYQE